MKVWIDGKLYDKDDARISVFDHGLLYGDGVFEGIRVYGGCIFRLREHLERLWDGARYIMLEIPMTVDEAIDAVVETVRATDDPAVALDRFLSGPGYPGIAANLPTREELYAEREEELLRRYESHRLRDGPGGASEATERRGLAEEPEPDPYAGPQSAKPE